MKTVYKKTLMWKYLKLPALIFFLLALSYNASAQALVPNKICYGAPINMTCTNPLNCSVSGGTYTWSIPGGSWFQVQTNICNTVTLNFGDPGYGALAYLFSAQLPGGILISTVSYPDYKDAIVLTQTITDPKCNGDNNGYITITANGGSGYVPPSGYKWSNGASTQNISGLSAGTYTVTVTDDENCSQISSAYVVTNPPGMVLSPDNAGSKTNVSCNGLSDGSIAFSVTGGASPYSYAWIPSGPNSSSRNGLSAGTYNVTVTDNNGCKQSGSYTITEPSAITISSDPHNPTCNGFANGYINIVASGGNAGSPPYTYTWSNSASTQNISGLTSGTYSVTVKDAGNCTKTGSWAITAAGVLALTPTVTQPKCVSDLGSISVSMSGGTTPYSYIWSNGHSATGATDLISGLVAGTYSVSVTDGNLCTTDGSWTITAAVALTAPFAKTNPTCASSNNGFVSVSVSGGVSPYSYNWSTPGGTTSALSGLAGGTYSVTITDFNNCVITRSGTITAPSELTITPSVTNALCNNQSNGKIDLVVTGGTTAYTYNWSGVSGTQRYTAHVTGLGANTYSVTVTDANSCTAIGSYLITEPDPLSGSGVVSNPICFGDCNGTATITGTGGTPTYTYTWVGGSHAQLLTGLCAGTYTVSITDANGCFNFTWQTITAPTQIAITGTPKVVTCNGGIDGQITTTVSGGTPGAGYTYLWSNNQIGSTATGLTAGDYTVTVTDANTCKNSQSFTVTANPALVVGLGSKTDPKCFTSSNGSITVTVSGGVSAYGYAWSAPGGTSSTLGGLPTGTYTVTVTDNVGCTTTGSWSITAPGELTITPSLTNALCNNQSNGKIDLVVTGGTTAYTYNWSGVSGTQRYTAHVTGLGANTYSVTVTDANSCTAIGSYLITEPDPLSGSGVVSNPICFGDCNGTATITGTGGTPTYTYTWVGGSHAQLLTGLCAGTYTVSITDANGCFNYTWQTITAPSQITILGTPKTVTCYGGSDGQITTTISGGTTAYHYLWSDNQSASTAVGLTAGDYTVTITDGNTCKMSKTFTVLQNSAISLSFSGINPKCNLSTDGSVTVTATGGISPYTYNWSSPFGSNATLSGLSTGTYWVTVTDNAGGNCTKTGSWSITAPSAVSLSSVVTPVTCYAYSTGAITASGSGGTPGYTYNWNTGISGATITGLTAGFYTVTVSDFNNCTKSLSWEVTQPGAWSVGIGGAAKVCCTPASTCPPAASSGSVYTAAVNLGAYTLPCAVTYEWVVVGGTITSGWNTSAITVSWACCSAGTVTVTATKCDGCTVSHTFYVAISTPPAPIITGPVTVFAHQDTTYSTPNFVGHLYSWTVVGGVVTGGQGTNEITVLWGAYPACGCGTVSVCETDTVTGCTGCNLMNINILPEGENLFGYVVYNNAYKTPMNNVTVKLRNKATGTIIATTVSGPNMNSNGEDGYFAFTNVVPSGSGHDYKLEASSTGTWFGNNATDALLVQLHIIGSPLLTGLKKTVADVNGSLTYTALDALYIKLRTVGSLTSYPAGNWKFSNPDITVPVGVNDTILGLNVGDVNGSNIPFGMKDASTLAVVSDGDQSIPVNESFIYNIKSNSSTDFGAMTLFMSYDQNRFEIENVNSSLDDLKYVNEDGKIALAWSDTKSMSVKGGDPIISLTMKAKESVKESTQVFSLIPGSEFADVNANVLSNFDLKMANVVTSSKPNEFNMYNFPNPFKGNTDIVYTIPEAGNVRLVLTDIYGKTISVLTEALQNAGTYTVTVNPAQLNLAPGVYLYKIEVAGTTETYVKANKMLFTR